MVRPGGRELRAWKTWRTGSETVTPAGSAASLPQTFTQTAGPALTVRRCRTEGAKSPPAARWPSPGDSPKDAVRVAARNGGGWAVADKASSSSSIASLRGGEGERPTSALPDGGTRCSRRVPHPACRDRRHARIFTHLAPTHHKVLPHGQIVATGAGLSGYLVSSHPRREATQ